MNLNEALKLNSIPLNSGGLVNFTSKPSGFPRVRHVCICISTADVQVDMTLVRAIPIHYVHHLHPWCFPCTAVPAQLFW